MIRSLILRCVPDAVKPAVRQPFDRGTDTRKYRRKRGYDAPPSLPPFLLAEERKGNDQNVHHPFLLKSTRVGIRRAASNRDTPREISRVDCVR